MQTYLGLDLSLTGTGAVMLREDGTVSSVLAWTTSMQEIARAPRTKRDYALQLMLSPEVKQGDAHASWDRTVDVADALSGWLDQNAQAATKVAIEDHAYGVKTNAVYRLGHLHGLVRYAVNAATLPFLLVEPTTVKFFATGKGRAEKVEMVEATNAAGFDLSTFGASTKHNVADAYWLAQVVRTWHALREKRIDLKDLPAHQARVFAPRKNLDGLLARELHAW
jgi:Holliday junction resolvasome RuvABC endonuclease subunit